MESRDSATSVTSGDEEGLLSFTAGLAKEAALLFQARRFTECIDVLNQLLQKKQDDPKVLHNIAVTEYFRDGCSDPKKLLDVLNKVKKRSEDLSKVARELVEDANNGSIPGSRGSSTTLHRFSNANGTRIAFSDEFDTSIVTLNIAVVLFHLHEYAKALSLLEPLYQNIEPIEETTALHIFLLFLDVALASKDASRAADVIQRLERAMIGQGENQSSSQHQSSNPPVKASTAPSNLSVQDTSNLDSTSSANSSENLARNLSEDALAYEELLSTLDMGGQNLARPVGLFSSDDLSRTSADRPAPAVDLKLKLHLYKVRFLLLTKNLKAAKREVKLAINIARGVDSSTALLLKSQLEYSRGNHRKAIKLLMTSSSRMETGMPGLFNNNLGCISNQLKKHHISTVLFSKALRSNSLLQSEKPLKLSSFSQDKSLLIVYNCGLQHLACRKPQAAARCFLQASSVFFNRPLLWLRIAECCLLALEMGFLTSSGVPTAQNLKAHVIGQGKWRRLVVENGYTRNGNLNSIEQNDKSLAGDGQTKLSVPFARQCLFNALHLLNDFELKSSKIGLPSEGDELNQHTANGNVAVASAQPSANSDAKDPKGSGVSSNTTLQSSISAYNDICRRENHMIKQVVLADLAYLELNLENALKALAAAKSLLMLPECTRMYMFLGHLYAAEALCILNRLEEAAEHLSVYVVGNNVELPYREEDTEKWRVDKSGGYEESNGGSVAVKNPSGEECQRITFLGPEEARGTLYANFATMSAIQGNLEQAHRFATKALSMIPKNQHAVLTSVYVDLLLGNSNDALIKLKQCSSVRFLSTGVTLNGSC